MDVVIGRGVIETRHHRCTDETRAFLRYHPRRHPQAQVYLREGSANNAGKTADYASEARRKRRHCARPGHVSFDQRGFKLMPYLRWLWPPCAEEGYFRRTFAWGGGVGST